MPSKVLTGAVIGLDGAVVEVEVDIASGNAHFVVVGLPDAAVQESKERVRAAIRNSGCTFPYKRIAVSLAPAELKKEGASYDLPIAVAILEASGQLVLTNRDQLFLGELALDGALRPTSGILSIVALAKEKGVAEVYVPAINAAEAALIGGVRIMPVKNLTQLVTHLRGEGDIGLYSNEGKEVEYKGILYTGTDLADIKGQEHAKRALEISASGSHNVLFIGPPGTGKTLLARALPSILPEMTTEESLEVTRIYSVAGLLPPETPLITQRPFRAPHHTISSAGLVGGGRVPRPGEITPFPSRRLVPRRAAGVWYECFGAHAATPGGQGHHHQPCTGLHDVFGEFHPRGRHEPVSLRILHGSRQAVQLLAHHGGPIPKTDQRAASRPR